MIKSLDSFPRREYEKAIDTILQSYAQLPNLIPSADLFEKIYRSQSFLQIFFATGLDKADYDRFWEMTKILCESPASHPLLVIQHVFNQKISLRVYNSQKKNSADSPSGTYYKPLERSIYLDMNSAKPRSGFGLDSANHWQAIDVPILPEYFRVLAYAARDTLCIIPQDHRLRALEEDLILGEQFTNLYNLQIGRLTFCENFLRRALKLPLRFTHHTIFVPQKADLDAFNLLEKLFLHWPIDTLCLEKNVNPFQPINLRQSVLQELYPSTDYSAINPLSYAILKKMERAVIDTLVDHPKFSVNTTGGHLDPLLAAIYVENWEVFELLINKSTKKLSQKMCKRALLYISQQQAKAPTAIIQKMHQYLKTISKK